MAVTLPPIQVLDFYTNDIVIVEPEEDLVYAEDLVFHLTSSLNITTVCAHLFSLYSADADLWLCPNQRLDSLDQELGLTERRLQLRIRFVPTNLITKLQKIDVTAFEYYFLQIRHDFLHIPKKKYSENEFRDVFGMALEDIMRLILEDKDKIKNINKQSKHYINNYRKFCPQNMIKPWWLWKVKPKMKKSFQKNFKPNIDVNWIKFSYMNQFLRNVHCFYNVTAATDSIPLCELYEIVYESHKNVQDHRLLWYRFDDMNFYWKKMIGEAKKEWEPAFTVTDVSNMIVMSMENRKLMICLNNQPALTLSFVNIGKMKSFVSLLCGYYRLIVHWNLNISSEFFSPLLNTMKKTNCFGPIEDEHVKERLMKFHDENKNITLFLLKQSKTDFKILKVCFEKDDSMHHFEIEWKPTENPTFMWDNGKEEIDYAQLLVKLRQTKNLFHPISSEEKDHFPDLLLCRKEECDDVGNKESTSEFLHSIPNDQIKRSILTILNNGFFCTKIGVVKLNPNREEKVFIKEFIETKETNLDIVLKEYSEWSTLKNVAILNCKGIVPHPLSILFEQCHNTLREYFTRDFKVNDCNLTEAVYFLAKAIDYLYTKRLAHGYIKLDNLYVSYFSKSSLFIKLGDPIGYFCDFNPISHTPWLPPEYFERNTFYFRQRTSHGDVWAFATTVWEIFNRGLRPQFDYSMIESVNLSNTMPYSIQTLVKRCWDKSFYTRIQPSGVCREMIRILSKLYDNRKTQQQYVGPNDNFNLEKIVDNKDYYKSNSVVQNNVPLEEYQRDFFDLVPSPATLEDAFMISGQDDLLQMQAMNNLEFIPNDAIRVLDLIGEGNFGKVFRIEHEDGFYALKAVVDNRVCSLTEEIIILAKLRHKNIVKILGYTNDLTIEKTFYRNALIMEYLPLGSLKKFLRKKNRNDKLELTKLATDIASGLDFLCSKSIIHRDLAARNILVASENSVKITDFGLAHVLEDTRQYYKYKTVENPLPFRWHAPESFENFIFTFKSDIWSYGIVLWEMYTYCQFDPFEEIEVKYDAKDLLEFLKKGNRLYRPENCPESVYDLMQQCWQFEPEKRPTSKEIHTKIKAIDEQIRDRFI